MSEPSRRKPREKKVAPSTTLATASLTEPLNRTHVKFDDENTVESLPDHKRNRNQLF
jgi:hypothetical protein